MEDIMEERSSATLENILQTAMEEFSDKGFLGASLRQIVKRAGVTTGAFYGYFSSKEALFSAIVEPHAAALMGWWNTSACTVNLSNCFCAGQKAQVMNILSTTWWRWK